MKQADSSIGTGTDAQGVADTTAAADADADAAILEAMPDNTRAVFIRDIINRAQTNWRFHSEVLSVEVRVCQCCGQKHRVPINAEPCIKLVQNKTKADRGELLTPEHDASRLGTRLVSKAEAIEMIQDAYRYIHAVTGGEYYGTIPRLPILKREVVEVETVVPQCEKCFSTGDPTVDDTIDNMTGERKGTVTILLPRRLDDLRDMVHAAIVRHVQLGYKYEGIDAAMYGPGNLSPMKDDEESRKRRNKHRSRSIHPKDGKGRKMTANERERMAGQSAMPSLKPLADF